MMTTGRFRFPGCANRQNVTLEDFLEGLGLDRSDAEKLRPHIDRLNRARVLLKCTTNNGEVVDAEKVTQAIFTFVLSELIASFYAEELEVADVSGMESAATPIELSK